MTGTPMVAARGTQNKLSGPTTADLSSMKMEGLTKSISPNCMEAILTTDSPSQRLNEESRFPNQLIQTGKITNPPFKSIAVVGNAGKPGFKITAHTTAASRTPSHP
ncbi:hypothetical protein SDC9_106830 [bioreactor metagenome]|uniref:Uncharacterized protein n=1 Tax=bioreactor metagenome TaxID=1076179 RepID=A0A645BE47_9ZZZZ